MTNPTKEEAWREAFEAWHAHMLATKTEKAAFKAGFLASHTPEGREADRETIQRLIAGDHVWRHRFSTSSEKWRSAGVIAEAILQHLRSPRPAETEERG